MNLLASIIYVYRKTPLHPRATPILGFLLSKFRSEREVERQFESFSMVLNTAHFLDTQLLATGNFEADTTRVISRMLRPNMTVFDVGANIGWFSLVMASCVGPCGKVFAFEPSDWTYARLLCNIERNNFNWVNVERAAVGRVSKPDCCGKLPCGYRLDGRDTATEQNFPVVSLDDFVQLHSVEEVHFIKSDTDGHEWEVIGGAMSILRTHQPALILEAAAKIADSRLGDMFEALASLDYKFYDDKERELTDVLRATARAPGGTMNVLAKWG